MEGKILKMYKAYDTILQAEVSAVLAAQNGKSEPYRYECLCCGEEVYIAAAYSTRQVAHFRHRSGNNDIECENYLGKYGTFSIDTRSRKNKNERAEFYYDNKTKMFYLGLKFSEDEISAYEQLSAAFELRASPEAQPFYSIQINSRNFTSDIQRLIPLSEFSHTYFLSNTLNDVKRKYEMFNILDNSAATFFKTQVNDSSYRAKLVRSSVLYTNVSYFVVFQGQGKPWLPMEVHLPNEIKVESFFKFETMSRRFFGGILTITAKTEQIDSLLSSWGYQLEAAEMLTLLWPPAIELEDMSLIYSDTAYLYSTFELQAHGNINVHSKDITRIGDGITKVTVKPRTKIYKKNAELMLELNERESSKYDRLIVAERFEKHFQVAEDESFMFNSTGVLPLSKGTDVYMTPEAEVKYYSSGYLKGIVVLPESSIMSGKQLLQDALIHYKRLEMLDWDDFGAIDLSQIAFQYIKDCEKTGLINSAVKHLIEEGRI
ncbi:hypothetical protein [Enterocloster bolteae]|uniref:hypothetical protein n=2 Tax=Enterocloster bolteae TaxID=208479 RepID=UPI00210DEC99|nr:hypothetical protein [Enterocloster bolteae]